MGAPDILSSDYTRNPYPYYKQMRDDLDVKRAYGGDANHLTFGMGRHFCVGSMLARVEVTIATNLLLDEMRDIAFKDGFTPQEEGIFLRACEKLEVRFMPFKVSGNATSRPQ